MPEDSSHAALGAKLFYGIATGVFVFCAASIVHRLMLADPDTLWHVRVGLDILAQSSFPRTDVYSSTFFGYPWIAKEWLGQVVLALGYLWAGWNGVVLVAALAYAVAAALVYRSLARSITPVLSAGSTVALMVLVSITMLARPHVISFPFLVLWTDELFRSARSGRSPPFWLLAVMTLWANIHAAFTLGFVIAMFAFLDAAERTRLSDKPMLLRWIAFGALVPLASIVHPYGVQSILATFTIALGNDAVPNIAEWVPLSIGQKPVHVAVLILVAATLLYRPVKTSLSRAAFTGLMLYMFVSHIRFVYALFMLAPITLGASVAAAYPAISAQRWISAPRDKLEETLFRFRKPLMVALGAVTLIFGAGFAIVPGIAPPPSVSAAGALVYARAHDLKGNVLNSYDFGGALIFNRIPTFVDGRTDQLFLGTFWQNLQASAEPGGQAKLGQLLKQYDVSWTLLARDDRRNGFLARMPDWEQVYSDEFATIFVKRQANIPQGSGH